MEHNEAKGGAIEYGEEEEQAVGHGEEKEPAVDRYEINLASSGGKSWLERMKRVLGKSVHIRHVDSGSCNGCDWEMTHLLNSIYDVQRLGFDFVASPRHADFLMVTGGVTRNLETALRRTYAATPEPRVVVAVGTCACSGGVFQDSYAVAGGVDKIVPVQVYIPGCPPRPQALIQGLMLALDKMEQKSHSTGS